MLATARRLEPRTRRYTSALAALVAAAVVSLGHLGGGGLGGPDPASGLTGVPDHPTDYGDPHFTWLATQPADPSLPVGYNPCRPIPVEINYTGATPDILVLTQQTIADLNRASGLHLVYAGASQHFRRTQGVTGMILISFNDLPHDEALADAAGVGGSLSYAETPPGVTKYYVGGEVTLNTSEFNHYDHHAQALVLGHELGHALGLGHVDDPGQVMMSGNYAVDGWGRGDLTALARLGRLPCQ